MTSDLKNLLRFLENETEFNRELDLELGIFLLGWTIHGDMVKDHEGNIYVNSPGGMYPSPTESLEIAVTFVKHVFPQMRIVLQIASDCSCGATIYTNNGPHFNGYAPTPALALCVALVRGFIATKG